MEIKGKIIQKLPPQSGVSKSGTAWSKQGYVLQTFGDYPKQIKFDFFGDKANDHILMVGDIVTVSIDIESREFNGRWYTDIHAYNAIIDGGNEY
jgi:hypothetical protein